MFFMSNIIKDFWMRVDQELETKNMTVAELARRTGIKYDSFKTWRTRTQIPNPEALVQISNVLGVSIDYLFKGELDIEYGREAMLAVTSNEKIQSIVRRCQMNPALLEGLYLITQETGTRITRPLTVGDRIRMALDKASLSDYDLEGLTDIQMDELLEYEGGYVTPSDEVLQAISKVTKTDFVWLKTGDIQRGDKSKS